jgi:hypothetical protein
MCLCVQAVARIEARLTAWNQLDSTIKECEESYPSIDVHSLKQWAAQRSTDGTIKTAAIQVCHSSEALLSHSQSQWPPCLPACVSSFAVACACTLRLVLQTQYNRLLDAMDAADADAAAAMDEQEGADGGGDDDGEGEEEAGEDGGAAAHPAAKKRRLEHTTKAPAEAEAEPEKEF